MNTYKNVTSYNKLRQAIQPCINSNNNSAHALQYRHFKDNENIENPDTSLYRLLNILMEAYKNI